MVWLKDTAYLLLAYAKAEQSDLTLAQRRVVSELVTELTHE